MTQAWLLPPGVQVLERGWLSANNIVFSDGVTAVVDTGYWTHQAQTVALVSGALGNQDLSFVLNTHLHSDHCGGNAALAQRYPHARLLIPPGQSQHVEAWDATALTYEPTGQHCPPFSFNGLLRSGDELQLGQLPWQIHSAPGHDPHSVILFEPSNRILISADALWENGFGVVFQELEGDRAFDEVAQTLDLVERLNPHTVIPGHGRIFSDVAAALDRARKRLDGFIRDPRKHAHHAAKVLLKFKLLEEQRIAQQDLMLWVRSTPYFQLLHERYFAGQDQAAWVELLVHDLIRVKAASRDGQYVLDQ